jgi:hypothetical protein
MWVNYEDHCSTFSEHEGHEEHEANQGIFKV